MLWERRRAQRLAKSSNLNTEGEPTTKAMGDEPNGRDYCGKIRNQSRSKEKNMSMTMKSGTSCSI
jgi:hypothetical protein